MIAKMQRGKAAENLHHTGNNKQGNWFPLGYAQHCFWFVSTALGDTANNQVGILIEGELRIAVLEQAINTLIQSHTSLRTEILDYAPMQRLCQMREFDLPLLDLSAYDADKQEQRVLENSQKFLHTPFNLKSPPHLRAQIFRLAESKHLLFLCFPHIVADGGAIHLFEQQLWRLYQQGCHGKKHQLSLSDQMQIDEWVCYERETHHQHGQQDLAFWRQHLKGYPYARFPARYLNQNTLTDHEFYLPFPENSYDLLDTLAKQQKATLQMVFLTLVAEVIYTMTGQSRFSLNSVLEGREQPGSETLMAPMLRVMPVPVNLDSLKDREGKNEATTIALLEQVREKILSAYDHMECPWSLPVGVLAEQRWHSSPGIYSLAIRAGSWLYSKVFRRARLYPHFLADFLFMEPRPPQSIIRRARRSVEISQPTININILQDVFKSETSGSRLDGLRLSSYWKSEHREHQALPGQAISTQWENDSINIYVTLSEDSKPIMQINCCCFNQAGMACFTGLLKEKLSSLSQLITE
ncbi:condensation domain-containing protein [Xenorhabdus sp. KK7.4]|uniref:condensation domain-containing protein n=1 Tax=Xenorhabdus sp. KK7.4 TaxID=1851572 RepID=UPI000C0460F2|nr:condensation domain-containing protein [Xenorhabdus sp. KK7.4]PHM58476.1 peptide synthase [Xenorhabdus sp. KK7.4]